MNKRKLAFCGLYGAIGALALVLVFRDAGLATTLKAVLAAVAYAGVIAIMRSGECVTARVRGSVELPDGSSELLTSMAEERLKASMLDVLTEKGVASTRVWTEGKMLTIETVVDYCDRSADNDDESSDIV